MNEIDKAIADTLDYFEKKYPLHTYPNRESLPITLAPNSLTIRHLRCLRALQERRYEAALLADEGE